MKRKWMKGREGKKEKERKENLVASRSLSTDSTMYKLGIPWKSKHKLYKNKQINKDLSYFRGKLKIVIYNWFMNGIFSFFKFQKAPRSCFALFDCKWPIKCH